jgi:SHS2 domain-containing protein
MGSFEILPHTADLRLKVTGETLKDLFEHSVIGLSDILKPGECSTLNVEHSATSTYDVEVEVAGVDETILLIDFEVIIIFDI